MVRRGDSSVNNGAGMMLCIRVMLSMTACNCRFGSENRGS
jgi:hypothetical protein